MKSNEKKNYQHCLKNSKSNCKIVETNAITEGAITNGQSRDIGNIAYTRHKTKTNKTTQKIKMMNNTDPIKNRSVNSSYFFL